MSELLIRPVDPSDGADMDAFQSVYAAAELAEDPDVGLYSRQDAISLLTSDSGEFFRGWGAYLDGRMVAEAIIMGSTRDNLQVGQLLLWVDPPHQGRGHGGQLLRAMEEQASALGRTTVRVQARAGERHAGNRRFAERHGYRLELTEVERRLPLPVDPALLDRLAGEAAAYHEDYEILAFVGPVPAPLRASYVDLRNKLVVEMPTGDLELEEGRHTVGDLEAGEREREKAGRTRVSAFAVRNGAVVAYADASVPGGDARHVDQFGTLVDPGHRGHRLGMAVKCAQVRLLSERFGDRAYVQTSNAETNAHMVAINLALGFGVHQVWGEFEKRLPPATTG